MIHGSLSGAIWFLVFLTFKIGVFHLQRVKNKSAVILRLFLGAVVGHCISGFISGFSPVGMLAGLLIMFSFFILYMPFYYTISSSVSIQTLVLLSEKPSRSRPAAELKEAFASKGIVRHKLESMINSGLLVKHEEAYKTTSKGRLIANVFWSIKVLWDLGAGG